MRVLLPCPQRPRGWSTVIGCCVWLGTAFPALAISATNAASPDKVPASLSLAPLRTTVETLRGKTFRQKVPAFTISERELRAVVEREVEQDYPGAKLADYEALMTWLGMLPPGTSLKQANAAFAVDQVAGLYDSDTKEMYIPSLTMGKTNAPKARAKKEAERFSTFADDLILTHELTHALEDQYWPLDDTNAVARRESTDREEARSFLAEGSATRIMIEAVPAQLEQDTPGAYPIAWNVMHSGLAEWLLDLALLHVWKSPDAQVPGVPQALACSEAMPYSYGYVFCSGIMRDWGLDGLDYVCDHLPVSTAQIIHPAKAWQWRDLPAEIRMPTTLQGGWKELAGDSLGEAGVSVLFGCAFKSLNRGERLAQGWDGDRAALYTTPEGHRLLIWASCWESRPAASRFASAWLNERRKLHKAALTLTSPERTEWVEPDGRRGALLREDNQVLIFATDKPDGLSNTAAWREAISFTQPPEERIRAADNPTLLRYNPLFSRQKDADYTVTRTLGGLLSRHDRNSIGAADCLALGLVGDWSRTASFNKWQLGWSLVAKHQSDTRRGVYKTALLPWGVLYGHLSARLPQDPARTVSRSSLVWGLAISRSKDSTGRTTFDVLPAGILFKDQTSPSFTGVHVLGTGISRSTLTSTGTAVTRYHLFGIRLWTTRSAAAGG